ncbi:MAG: PqqD family protein [Methanobacteriota archaeon]
MRRTTKKSDTNRLPTVEEFLRFQPKRLDFPWETDEQGLVHITVPKFTSTVGKQFCQLVRKENVFTANLDKLGSLVWAQCDGDTTVQQILDRLKNEYPDQKNIDQRLFLFLYQMNKLRYLTL